MIRKAINLVRQLLAFLKKWLYPKKELLKATDVLDQFSCFKYNGQWINMHASELPEWKASDRKKRRKTAMRFKQMQKKGKIRFEKINGKMSCIKNKDYGNTESRE
jgi:hypothetical protein